jgi:hypothetical protein
MHYTVYDLTTAGNDGKEGNRRILLDYIMMIRMSMGSVYVFEMWPPTSLLFIPQVTYEHGEPWWNDIGGEFLIRPPELSTIIRAEKSSSK